MTAEIHKHHWKRFRGYGKNAWRCTTAETRAEIERREPCGDDCEKNHRHYVEHGCLATAVRWGRQCPWVFSAPGAGIAQFDEVPSRMLIDDDYRERMASFAESLKLLAA